MRGRRARSQSSIGSGRGAKRRAVGERAADCATEGREERNVSPAPQNEGGEAGSGRGEEDNAESQHAVVTTAEDNPTQPAPRQGRLTIRDLQQELESLRSQVPALVDAYLRQNPPPPAEVPPQLTYLADHLQVQERGIDRLLEHEDSQQDTEGNILFRPEGIDVQG